MRIMRGGHVVVGVGLAALAAAGTATGGVAAAGAPDVSAKPPAYTNAGLDSVSVVPHSTIAWADGEKAGATLDTTFPTKRVNGKWSSPKDNVPDGVGISAIAAGSPTAIWTVGTQFNVDETETPYIQHSTGGKFRHVATSLPFGNLADVAATSATNAWALGELQPNGFLLVRWDGHTWTQQKNFPATASSYEPIALSVSSKRNVWVLGGGNGFNSAFRYHNGIHQGFQILAPAGTQMTGIAAISPTNVWAVGHYDDDSGTTPVERSVAFHWNGHGHKAKEIAVPEVYDNTRITSIAASGPTVYLAGEGYNGADTQPSQAARAVVLVRHGSGWTKQKVTEVGKASRFNSIAASTKAVVAVGLWTKTRFSETGGGPPNPLIEGLVHGKWKKEKPASLN